MRHKELAKSQLRKQARRSEKTWERIVNEIHQAAGKSTARPSKLEPNPPGPGGNLWTVGTCPDNVRFVLSVDATGFIYEVYYSNLTPVAAGLYLHFSDGTTRTFSMPPNTETIVQVPVGYRPHESSLGVSFVCPRRS